MNLTDFGTDGFTLADLLLVTTTLTATAAALWRITRFFYRLANKIEHINASVNYSKHDEDPHTRDKGVRQLIKDYREEQRQDYLLLLGRLDSHIINHDDL